MKLRKHIHIQQGFQSSVNIAYDLQSDEKLENFIPTNGVMDVLESLLLSTYDKATDRAKILVGAYGKGKSHAILVLLNLLSRKDKKPFKRFLNQLKVYKPELYEYVNEYIKSSKKLLPVVIQGSNDSMTQSFLAALDSALKEADLENIMPETHFQAALKTIARWKTEYPATFEKFTKTIDLPVKEFCESLKEFDVNTYNAFTQIYPNLTAGSEFNPLLGFDVVELYSKVTDALCEHGYSGIYVVYDEFSKYLEANITRASVSDIKMLQDFAEKCGRSKEKQMHLLLIVHKDIANYIDKLPKQKVDGWKGVSERFVHIEMQNNFSQVYELMATVLQKDDEYFEHFYEQHEDDFKALKNSQIFTDIFSELSQDRLSTVLYGCYPLHPVTAFILPRLSELVAQNERTLFTFLSSPNRNTLASFLTMTEADFPLVTPDLLYDYFESSIKNVPYVSEIHNIYSITTGILNRIGDNVLEAKIIKILALTYIVNRPEKLAPTLDLIIYVLSGQEFSSMEVSQALEDLQDKEYVLYANKSNHFLRLKSTTGSDIQKQISDTIAKNKLVYDVKKILTDYYPGLYMFPAQYNDEMCITRYFDFKFINGSEFLAAEDLLDNLDEHQCDGVIYGIIPESKEQIKQICDRCCTRESSNARVLFVVPKEYEEIKSSAFMYQAVKDLKNDAADDEALLSEYNIYEEDMEEVLSDFVHNFIKPEIKAATYYYCGEKKAFNRKAQVSQCLSDICYEVFRNTPIINNESINKNILPPVAINSRNRVIQGLLDTQWQPMLGLKGSGQDISFMRSTLLVPGLIHDIETKPVPNLHDNEDEKLQDVLNIIENFFIESGNGEGKNFAELYNNLIAPEQHIGLRKGIIPIYIALIIHQFKEHLVVSYNGEEREISADLLNSINEEPEEYTAYLEEWNLAKTNYIQNLEVIFKDYIIEKEKEYNSFSYIVRAMQRWFVSLPQYTKDIKKVYEGSGTFMPVNPKYLKFIRSLSVPTINPREYLFEELVRIFAPATLNNGLVEEIKEAKAFYNWTEAKLLGNLEKNLIKLFEPQAIVGVSLVSALKDWYGNLSKNTRSYVFEGNNGITFRLFKNITSYRSDAVERLAKATTGLSVDDWNDATVNTFIKSIKNFKSMVEKFDGDSGKEEIIKNGYEIAFVDKTGNIDRKHFAKVEASTRGKLLKNSINNDLEEMGQAISQEEKRQILMDILEKLC
jgi:hypothetical protein